MNCGFCLVKTKSGDTWQHSEIANKLDPCKDTALPFFHAFTGCDIVSSFKGKGKKQHGQFGVFDDVIILSNSPQHIPQHCEDKLERFVVLLYDRTSELQNVNEARVHLVSQGNALDNITPTQAALKQQIVRASYTGGHTWGEDQLTRSNPTLLSPESWGWIKETTGWKPLWTTLPEASKACWELIKCGCKLKYSRSKCVKECLKCTCPCACSCDTLDYV